MPTGKREDHKYIARVQIGSKNGRNQYRYFYDKPSYNAYLKQTKTTNTTGSNTLKKMDKAFVNSLKELGKKLSNSNPAIKKFAEDKQNLSNLVKNFKASKKTAKQDPVNPTLPKTQAMKKVDPKVSDKTVANKQKELVKNKTLEKKSITKDSAKYDEVKNKISKIVGKTLKEINEQLNKAETKESTKVSDKNIKPTNDENLSGKSVTLPDGSTKRFASIDEYNDYQARLEYQKNEPSFMKNVAKISDTIIHSKLEDMEKVNEQYIPIKDEYSRNCSNCSVAYELRRRGYDVEAKSRDENYNGGRDRLYDYFENAKVVGISGDGSSITYNERYVRDTSDGDGKATLKDDSDKASYKFDTTEHNYTAESIEKGILENSPPGSRGFIDVSWKAGSAHSIMYEVDSKGKVTIRDSQTYDEYELDELADRVKKVTICRSDNLQVKEDILDAVRTNEDNERYYYNDKGTAYLYKK